MSFGTLDEVTASVECGAGGLNADQYGNRLAVGALMNFVSAATLPAGANIDVGAAAQQAAESEILASKAGGLGATGSITREGIVNGLTGLTDQGNAISASINSGATKLNVLGDNLFEQAYALKGGVGEAPQAFALENQIYLRQSSANLLSDIVHEGTHSLDYLNSFSGSNIEWEIRAFSAERAFQQAGGGTVEFNTERYMLNFINKNYR
jgi:hypothetical protein